jgi:hypothetical protein
LSVGPWSCEIHSELDPGSPARLEASRTLRAAAWSGFLALIFEVGLMNVASDGCSRASRTDYLRPGPASAEEGTEVLVGASTMDVRYPLRLPLPSRERLDQVYFVALDAQQARGAASVIHQVALQQTDNSTVRSTAAKPRMSVSRCSLQARRRSRRAPHRVGVE